MRLSSKDILLTIALSFALVANPMAADAAHHHRAPSRHNHHTHRRVSHSCKSVVPATGNDQQSIDQALASNPAGTPAAVNGAQVFRDGTDRNQWYISQVESYTCGPSTMAMAISRHVLHAKPTLALVDELAQETGTDPCDGMPDWWLAMPPVLQKHGLQTKNYVFQVGDKTAMDALDAELLQGHSAIAHVNNPRTHSGNGHFVYVDGKTKDGRYIIGNPDAPANSVLGHNKPISRQELENMIVKPPRSHPKYYKGVPGFVAVW